MPQRLVIFVLCWLLLAPGLVAGEEERQPPAPRGDGLPKGVPADLDAMVLVPAGPGVVGYDEGKRFERPRHAVVLDAFRIDVYAVTNFQYRRFVEATGHPAPPH